MLNFMRKHARTVLIIVVLAFVITIPASYVFFRGSSKIGGSGEKVQRSALGTIGGLPIDENKFGQIYNYYASQQAAFGQPVKGVSQFRLQYMALQQAADYTLILSEADKKGVKVDNQDIKKEIDNIKERTKTKTNWSLNRYLKKNFKTSFKEVANSIREGLKVENFVNQTKDELWAKAYPAAAAEAAKKAAEAKKPPAKQPATAKPAAPIVSPEEQKKTAEIEKQKNDLFQKWFESFKKANPLTISPPQLRAFQLVDEGKLDEAAAVYQSALSADSTNTDIYSSFFLAQILEKQGKPAQAITELRKATLKMRGNAALNDPEIYLALATLYDKTGQKTQAAEQVKEAAKYAGEDLMTNLRVMFTAQQLGQTKLADELKAKVQQIQAKQQAEQEKKQKEAEAKAGKKGQTGKTPAQPSGGKTITLKPAAQSQPANPAEAQTKPAAQTTPAAKPATAAPTTSAPAATTTTTK